MANTLLIASVTGIVVSGVVGPATTAWAARRAARKQFLRDPAAKRRDEGHFTFESAIRQELLDRLLELNHARHADEVRRGLHDRNRPRRPRATKVGQSSLLSE